jgi:hypothetical protein
MSDVGFPLCPAATFVAELARCRKAAISRLRRHEVPQSDFSEERVFGDKELALSLRIMHRASMQ